MSNSPSAPKELRHNIVVFGETGVGKSSVINMIADNAIAKTSADASGCTFESKPHNATLNNKRIRIWDTAGLNEGEMGTVTTGDAIINLYRLLKGLDDGVSLLVLCMRAPKIRNSTVRNYKVFHHGMRLENVPIVLVVTGLEEEEDMDHWWVRNEGVFEKQKMPFNGHACITATEGKQRNHQYMFAKEYEESGAKVRELVWDYCSAEVQKAEQPRLGVIGIVKVMLNIGTEIFNIPPLVLAAQLYKALKEEGGYSGRAARQIANEAEISVIRKAGGWVPRGNTTKDRPSPAVHAPTKDLMHNVVVFGDRGVGKGSVINMIADNPVAKTSTDASVCTLESTSYVATSNDKCIRIWDTSGLPDGGRDAVTARNKLITDLEKLEGGVSLLVLCMRGPKILDSTVRNYEAFHQNERLKNAPMVLVVTGLEEQIEGNTDAWWDKNKAELEEQRQMLFDRDGHACITATKGKEEKYDEEYGVSKEKVRKLVWEYCSA